jgi:nucleotide-binding universal stress UspA family protein
MNRILVATDGSASSSEAVELGVELAAEHMSELIFVHVVPALDVVPSTVFAIGGAFPHKPSRYDRELLEDAAVLAASHGVVATTALLAGDTVDEIVAFADSHDVDVIVVGSRGHGTLATTVLGSVSRGVLRETKRPVLVVRAAAGARPARAQALGMSAAEVGSRPQNGSGLPLMAAPPQAPKLVSGNGRRKE